MRLVIDANILFAALIANGPTANIICGSDMELYAPEYLLVELERHIDEISAKTHRQDMEEFLRRCKTIIHTIPDDTLTQHLHKASCSDEDDTAYVALSIALNCPLWSNDSQLRRCNTNIITTKELLQIL
ncbi:TPA: PIN domain-containing protein [Candidatus Woesearchaeota archaeon]|nr:PIN domain-containing protein [Candidatus Woesearchaeota archaeon]